MGSSETLINIYQTTWCHILHSHHSQHLKSYMWICTFALARPTVARILIDHPGGVRHNNNIPVSEGTEEHHEKSVRVLELWTKHRTQNLLNMKQQI
jgi:hypothetical protein